MHASYGVEHARGQVRIGSVGYLNHSSLRMMYHLAVALRGAGIERTKNAFCMLQSTLSRMRETKSHGCFEV